MRSTINLGQGHRKNDFLFPFEFRSDRNEWKHESLSRGEKETDFLFHFGGNSVWDESKHESRTVREREKQFSLSVRIQQKLNSVPNEIELQSPLKREKR